MRSSKNSELLSHVSVVNTGLNLPGPLAAKQLADLGARAVKIEPPAGDTFEKFCPPWYEAMREGVECRRVDLKTDEGQAEMEALLARADVLITSQRPGALLRMGLESEKLRARHPRLGIVNIVGLPSPHADAPGHDLTYQAEAGLLDPDHPTLPRSLVADIAGAQQATIAALALLAASGGVVEVALSEAAKLFALPLVYGLTRPGGLLGGGHAGYNVYRTADSWVSVTALEQHFWSRLREQIPSLPADPVRKTAREILSATFSSQTTAHWAAWAQQHDLPIEPIWRTIRK